MWKISCFVLLATGLTLCHCVDPGFKLRTSQKGLDYINTDGKTILENAVKAISLPDIKHTEGNFTYNVTQMKIEKFTIIESSLTPIPNTGIQIAIKNCESTIKSNWTMNNGTFQVEHKTALNYSEATITMVFNISKNDTGSPLVSVSSCTSNIKKVEVRLNKAMNEMIRKNSSKQNLEFILKVLNAQLCPALTTETMKLISRFTSFLAQHTINEYVESDLRLVNSPVCTANYVDMDMKGTFSAINNSTKYDFAPAVFSLPNANDSMMYVGISESSLNSLSQAYFDDQALRLVFINEEFKNMSGAFIQAPEKIRYVRGRLRANKAPVLTLAPNNMTITFVGIIESVIKEPQKVAELVVAVNVACNITVDQMSITGTNSTLNITGSLTPKSVKLSFQSINKAKYCKYVEFKALLKAFIENKLIQYFNGKMKKGITFSQFPLNMVNPVTYIYEKFIQVNTDVKF